MAETKHRVGHLAQEDWEHKGVELFGPEKENWRFACPACGTVASIAIAREKWPQLRGSGWAPHQECVGRYGIDVKTSSNPARRCDWCAYGLFRGPVVVNTVDGKEIGVFDFDGLPFTGKAKAEGRVDG